MPDLESDSSLALLMQASECEPKSPTAYFALGRAFEERNLPVEAEACYRRAVSLDANFVEAHCNLGVIAGSREQYGEAAACFRKAVALRPELPLLRYNLGCALIGLGQIESAIVELQSAVRLSPDYWQAWSKLGGACYLLGQLDEALVHCSRAVEIAPGAAEAVHQLGVVLRESTCLAEAIACFQKALEILPAFGEAYFNLAISYQLKGELDLAADTFRRAIDADPGFAGSHCGLGIALGELGLADEAIAAFTRAIELKPDYQAAQSALLFNLYYSSRHSPAAVLDLHRRWAHSHARSLAPFGVRYANDRTPDRRLRIGYMSPDFRQHSVAFFLTPVLAHHDHRNFEIFCYSDVRKEDSITEQLKEYADCWRHIVGLSDEQVAAQVREDRIDVLVDLALHSGSNRLLVFARKPAPVQTSWLGYAGTTGLATIDYKITDPHLDPPGNTEAFHSEKLFRLPDSYWCYTPPPGHPGVSSLPALARGAVTFCAFQNLAKVSDQAVALWSRVLAAVPNSRLVIKARGLGGYRTRQRLLSQFSVQGVANDRLMLEDWADMDEYLNRFSVADIALDTTPFAGGTTTCHALWMGVPIVTLAGKSALGRMGASILQNLGLPELIAHSPSEYLDIAVRLSSDFGRLTELRMGLRQRMQHSPLTDATRFTTNIESAYRAMWVGSCKAKS